MSAFPSAAARDAALEDAAPSAPADPAAAPANANVAPQSPPAPPAQFAPAPARPAAPSPAPAQPTAPVAAAPKLARRRNGRLRFILLVVVPLAALAIGLWWWLAGGRYVTTDNAYVGADKVLVTPLISGPVVASHVVEGQKVKVGDPLFDIDPAPFNTALMVAKGHLDQARIGFENLKASYASNEEQIAMGEEAVRLRQGDFDRKSALVASRSGTASDRDTSMAALVQAKQILTFVRSQQEANKVKLGGGLNASIDAFPDYVLAKAQVEDAERNLRNTHVVASIAGVATQVAQIELGRMAPAGAPVFALVADHDLWVDGNPKESDLTYIREGLPATTTVDAFPDRVWKGRVCSIAPGTGAQFAILPPQNASGNWVKVVQRVPLRFCFDPNEDTRDLRAGMSAYVSIDTGRTRSLGSLLDALRMTIGAWVPHVSTANAALSK